MKGMRTARPPDTAVFDWRRVAFQGVNASRSRCAAASAGGARCQGGTSLVVAKCPGGYPEGIRWVSGRYLEGIWCASGAAQGSSGSLGGLAVAPIPLHTRRYSGHARWLGTPRSCALARARERHSRADRHALPEPAFCRLAARSVRNISRDLSLIKVEPWTARPVPKGRQAQWGRLAEGSARA
jgi:hypothetical protein